MSSSFAESHVEEAALAWLSDLGYGAANGLDIGPDGDHPERASYGDVLLIERLRAAIAKLNPTLTVEKRAEVLAKIIQTETPSLIEENRRLHRYIVEGVPIEVRRADGSIGGEQARVINFDDPDANDWLAVNQYTVIENKANRRPDVVIFVNGMPLGVIELKNPGDENATLDGAFNQLQTYKAQITSLFRTNAALVVSDGIAARIGSLTADRERFMPWRTVMGEDLAAKGTPELETVLKGVFERRRFLALMKDFIVFGDTGNDVAKILAGYHQFHAVRKAVGSTLSATAQGGDRKAGVIWHTQGSGKSLLMAFYAGQIIKHPAMQNPTLVVLTDRNDLDDQLFATFSMCKDLLRQSPQQAEDRDQLRKLLDRPSGGVIFTTLQKFAPDEGKTDYPTLTDRRNVIVIADEAHRGQYGFRAKIKTKTGAISYGFAKYLRDALPNASFIGFTGTPIEKDDVNTPAVFGEYIDIYDISRAVEDGATVPIYYESRLARIELDANERPKIDAEIEELTEDEAESEQDRLKRRWASVEALVGSDKRLGMVAQDLVAHFAQRIAALDGKAMIVCMSRRICVALYNAIVKLRPEWHSDDDEAGAIKVVMTGAASDPLHWQPHIGKRPKSRRELIAKRAKKATDPLKLVIVRDMWLTGFDAPSMHTMYVDKPMKGHGLMQAIARVNRVFRDKPAGLVVDYIGIAQNLKSALGQYAGYGAEQVGIDEAEAVRVLMEKYEIVRAMFHPDIEGGFDYRPALSATATPQARLAAMAGAMDWVLTLQQTDAAKETTEEGKKRAHRRYADAVVALSKAFALAGASDEAQTIRDDVGFFQAIRAALIKSVPGDGKKTATERELAIQQIVSRAVVSTEIVDIMKAAGLESPDISILSDDFLAEVRDSEKKNLAVEALKKLINGEVRSQAKRNVTQSKAFSDRLDAAILRYHNNALTTAQVLEDLIQLAKDIRAARSRGEETGLSDEEIAFYDALAENESARQIMGEPALRVIAHELVASIRKSVTVDWMHREAARARMRVLVKRLLRKYGYPPDLQDAAVQKVLQQAEALSTDWAA
ncbi:type I restriction endonuclease subunit R [Bradyrhizobium neotropicale]|uniref:type I restriction endonuclease subunit R n=1 Tax=Bradyrhizobium neotropicale TaxID=1497615 RepID=UPI001AD7B2EA|nr:type I restriction endonuclease subunit R [Bradyrhizobium neotropicale]MBO4221923.1 HsdR family type I site-specific deoxyribonuclease [Bradyrhizobium neotropicale]